MQKSIRIDTQTSRFLDSIRGFSAMIVLVGHINQIFILPYFGTASRLDDIFNFLASYAVMAFFIISGFVIGTNILRNIQENQEKFKVRVFLYDRLTRLVPPLLFSLLITIGVYAIIHYLNLNGNQAFLLPGDLYIVREKATMEWNSILYSLLFIQNISLSTTPPLMNGPLWSLSYEFWFYMLAMVFTNWLVNKRFFTGGILLMGMIVIFISIKNYLFLAFFLTWCGGVGWAILYHLRRDLYKKMEIYLLPVLLGLVGTIFFSDGMGLRALNNPYLELNFALFQTILCLAGMLILMQIASRLENKSSNFLGIYKTARFSFTLYVIHFPLLMLGFSLLHPILHSLPWGVSALVGSGLGVAILILSSWLSRSIEDKKTIRKVLNKFYDAVVGLVTRRKKTSQM
jgi:peptidoglycan/LPS O-acetylase OafA/YrhL